MTTFSHIMTTALVLLILSVTAVPNAWAASAFDNPTSGFNLGGNNTAQNAANAAGAQNSNSGGECDWSDIKESLYGTESKGSGGYTAVGPNTKYGRPLGKYQFIPPTQRTMINSAKNCNGQNCHGRAILQPQCHPVQECIMDAFLASNLEKIKSNSACQQLLAGGGRTISGCGQGKCLSCKATESGLLAAYHLGGADECSKLLRGSGDADNTGTSTGYYACKHGGKPVPGNCSPKDYGYTPDPFVSSPTLTNKQLQFAIESGDIHSINVSSDPLKQIWVAAFQLMTEQITTTMMQQAQIIGSFFDAKHQLETQRLMQQKYAQAHKDYHPSEQMCEFGTFVRDLSNSEIRTKATQAALSRSMIDRALVSGDGVQTVEAELSDKRTRLQGFIDKFCNKLDNGKGNDLLCQKGSPDTDQINRDIDYTATIEMPLTLRLNMATKENINTAQNAATAAGAQGQSAANYLANKEKDKENVFALLDNIFMNETWPLITKSDTTSFRFSAPYQDLRSLVAMRSVAQNSFAHIIGIKSQGPDPENENVDSAAPFMKAMMREMGMEDNVIEELLGKNPSYYAQMEILTKKIYQHPEFIANLYDKPANVKRIRATLTAIKLMQDRDIHQAMMRREMLMSMLLELQLRKKQFGIQNNIESIIVDDR